MHTQVTYPTGYSLGVMCWPGIMEEWVCDESLDCQLSGPLDACEDIPSGSTLAVEGGAFHPGVIFPSTLPRP